MGERNFAWKLLHCRARGWGEGCCGVAVWVSRGGGCRGGEYRSARGRCSVRTEAGRNGGASWSRSRCPAAPLRRRAQQASAADGARNGAGVGAYYFPMELAQ